MTGPYTAHGPGDARSLHQFPRARPRPWEALDVDGEPHVYPWVGWTTPDGEIESIAETEDATDIDCANVQLIVAAVNEYDALLGIEEVLRAARPILGLSVANSLGARADRALALVEEVRRGN